MRSAKHVKTRRAPRIQEQITRRIPSFTTGTVEINEQAKMQLKLAEVGNHLFAMDRAESINRLDFHDQHAIDKQIDFSSTDFDALVADVYWVLRDERDSAMC